MLLFKKKTDMGISKRHIIIGLVLFVMILAGSVAGFIAKYYNVTSVTVTGNRHYTEEQIKDIVMSGKFGNNSLYLSLKYKHKSVDNVPFVETMDVTILSPSEIQITVYEKAIAGYVEYLGRYMYFDKDGIIVETSKSQIGDIPYVTGLNFDHVVLYEKLPVENDEIFKEILSITQLLSKYEIRTDRIYFDSEMNVSLYFQKARVELGSMEHIDEKMMRLQNIIPKLGDLSGTLDMENYTDETDEEYITFQKENTESGNEIISSLKRENENSEFNDETSEIEQKNETSQNEIP